MYGACSNARELFVLQAVDAFSLQPHDQIVTVLHKQPTFLFLSDDNNEIGSDNTTKKKPRRVGGRAPKMNNKDKRDKGFPGWIVVALPILCIWLAFQNLFGSDFVYYQSTVFESTVVAPNGKVETARKESVRTNVPSLMEGRDKQLLQQSRAFDREIDRDIKTMFDEFF